MELEKNPCSPYLPALPPRTQLCLSPEPAQISHCRTLPHQWRENSYLVPGPQAAGLIPATALGAQRLAQGCRGAHRDLQPQTAGHPCVCQVRSLPGCRWPLQTSYLYEMK